MQRNARARECPPGHVLIIDLHGDSRATSASDLYIGRLKARDADDIGADGLVTDRGFTEHLVTAELRIQKRLHYP